MTKRLPEFTDIAGLERFTAGDYCEKQNLLVYASNQRGIFLVNLSDGSVIQVTAGGKAEGNPKFSKDGEKLLFLSAKEDGRQLYSYRISDGEVRKLSAFSGPILEPMWSPDGRMILFSSSISNAKGEQVRRRPDEPIEILDLGYKFDGLGYIRPDGHQHQFVLNTETGEVKKATNGESSDFLHAAWAPDSKSFVCVSDFGHSKSEMLMYDLFTVSVAPETFGEMKQISENIPIVSYPNPMRPVFTPDGSTVIMGAMNRNADFNLGYPDIFLYAFPVTGEAETELFTPDEDCYQCVQFPYNANCGWGLDKLQISEDGNTVYFHAGHQGQGVIYSLELSGDRHAKKLCAGKYVYHGMTSVQNGKAMVCRSETNRPETYLILDTQTGELTPVCQSAKAYLESVTITDTEDFFFDTEDGGRVHTFVVPAANRVPGEKYPAILYVHGGPHPFYTYGFTLEMQAFSAAGYNMIFCNPRGSSGYGSAHQDIRKSTDGTAFRDVIQAVKEACARFEFIDPDRVGATGGSYGGYMTNELALHSDAFRCYVTQRSMPSEMISYCSTDLVSLQSKNYESYEAFMMEKIKASQVSYAENLKKPILLLHGEDDYRTPVEGVHQFYTALKDLHPDIPVRLLIFPHTAHEQPTNPRLAKRYYQEMLDWFDRYLKEA